MAKFHEKIRKRKEKEKRRKEKQRKIEKKRKTKRKKICFIDQMQLSSVKNPAVG